MALCDSCGNDYEPIMKITLNGRTQRFDCFECAIHLLAPQCRHCATIVIGHGVQAEGEIFCCVHCAEAKGKTGLRDSA